MRIREADQSKLFVPEDILIGIPKVHEYGYGCKSA